MVKQMVSLTTWQRDLLKHLIITGEVVDIANLSKQLRLSLRQIRYGLREIEDWLKRQQVSVAITPRAGLHVQCSAEQRQYLLAELSAQSKFQLILLPEQRRQLIILALLVAQPSLILQQLQDDLIISRMTVLKDLEEVESWFKQFNLEIARRQHRGYWIEGAELAKRQALAALLWGDDQLGLPIFGVQSNHTVKFALAEDEAFLPIVKQVNQLLTEWSPCAVLNEISLAETALGVHFTEEAVTIIALNITLQIQRVKTGQFVACSAHDLEWIKAQATWSVAQQITRQLWPTLDKTNCEAESAALALHFLGNARDIPWSLQSSTQPDFHQLILHLMEDVAEICQAPQLSHDQLLHDGLNVLLHPAYVRRRFNLWLPRNIHHPETSQEDYSLERQAARKISEKFELATGVNLVPEVSEELVLLLSAAIIRTVPEKTRHILVVCPSGVATTQILVAKLRVRFLNSGIFEVLSIRELSEERIARADLLITTVPLSLPNFLPIKVIQVHPLLKSEDIAALSQWLN